MGVRSSAGELRLFSTPGLRLWFCLRSTEPGLSPRAVLGSLGLRSGVLGTFTGVDAGAGAGVGSVAVAG